MIITDDEILLLMKEFVQGPRVKADLDSILSQQCVKRLRKANEFIYIADVKGRLINCNEVRAEG